MFCVTLNNNMTLSQYRCKISKGMSVLFFFENQEENSVKFKIYVLFYLVKFEMFTQLLIARKRTKWIWTIPPTGVIFTFQHTIKKLKPK